MKRGRAYILVVLFVALMREGFGLEYFVPNTKESTHSQYDNNNQQQNYVSLLIVSTKTTSEGDEESFKSFSEIESNGKTINQHYLKNQLHYLSTTQLIGLLIFESDSSPPSYS